MGLKIAAVLAALFALAGCAGLNAAMQYDDVKPVKVTVRSHDWRIFDKPKENRLMITPSIGRSFAAGLPGGEIPKPEYAAAVEVWLKNRHAGKACSVIDAYVLANPQWEFKYQCA